MIIVMKPNASDEAVNKVLSIVESNGLKTHLSKGEEVTIIGAVGDKTKLDTCAIQAIDEVEKMVNITESYKLTNKKFHPSPTVITLRNTVIGPENMTMISGPCHRIRGADRLHRKSGKKSRRHHPARRCIQTPHQPVLLSGTGRGRPALFKNSFRGDRAGYGVRSHKSAGA